MANEQKSLLDLIDKLQFAQLDNIKLPQIVVVGDQSAGKSSVLEAITDIPFPRDAGACTRFATEIRLRRDKQTHLVVSIIPDKYRSFQEQAKLKEYGGTVTSNTSFDTLMHQAVDLIAPKNISGHFAARDILVVEKSGPDMPMLTLVDLPGLVRNANRDQSQDDIRTIEALSNRYMKSRRTIILAVVGGNSDYVQAPILTKARQFDPSGARTIGVLTKPDLTESIGLEDKFIELVQNHDSQNHFKLGWYVLLNPGPREPGQGWPSAEERHKREMNFFAQGRWAGLPTDICGASALKQKLSVQLKYHIGRHIKMLRKQIQEALDRCEAELHSIGEGRDTVGEMRIDLVKLFSNSNELVIPAVYGFYKNPPGKRFFSVTADPSGTPAQNLRARAVEENDRFSIRVRTNGRKIEFKSKAHEERNSGGGSGNTLGFGGGGKADYMRKEVETLLRQIRGSEFPGDVKPRAVYMLFQSYSENWPRLAQEHKDNLGVVCNEFLSEVIDYCWPVRMREPLREHFLDPQVRMLMEKAREELDRLVGDMHLEVQPYDPEYEERLARWRAEMLHDGGTYTEGQEVLEKMLIYYELSAKTFTRNVITQVIERHLLQGLYSVFESASVLGMPDTIVEAIVSEDRETRERRIALKKQKKAIEEARDICAGLAMRKELRTYAEESDGETTSSDDDDNHTYSDITKQKKILLQPSTHPVPLLSLQSSSINSDNRAQQHRDRRNLSNDTASARATAVDTDSLTSPSRPNDPRTSSMHHQPASYMESPSTPSAWNHPKATVDPAARSLDDYYHGPIYTPNSSSSPTAPKVSPPVPPPRPGKLSQQQPQEHSIGSSGEYVISSSDEILGQGSGGGGYTIGNYRDEYAHHHKDTLGTSIDQRGDTGSIGRSRLTPKIFKRS